MNNDLPDNLKGMPDTMVIAKEMANLFYREYQNHLFHGDEEHKKRNCAKGISEPDYEYGRLLMDWTKDAFYSKLVKDIVPVFEEVWNKLQQLGYISRKKCLDYGDYDVSVWAETHKKKKVLGYIRHCSMADNNTYIFVKYDNPDIELLSYFSCYAVWPREVKNKYYKQSVEFPSLNTLRKNNFGLRYDDARDKGHVFKYEPWKDRKSIGIDSSSWTEGLILRAIEIPWEIRTAMILDGLWEK